MLIIILCGAIEMLMYVSEVWKWRKYYIYLPLVFNLSCWALLYMQGFKYMSLGFVTVIFVFRFINYFRIIKNRIHSKHLRQAAFLTSLMLVTALVIIIGLNEYLFSGIDLYQIKYVQVLQLIIATVVLVITSINILKLMKTPRFSNYSDSELPTVSVCVPARNETQQLEICLTSLLASNYPKLEIIVYDDCSNDSTPEQIKKFAHDGVRFIQGTPPDDTWLPKNFAYQKLAEAAQGEFVLFCGVDTRFAAHTITKLVSVMLTNGKHMISILPRRQINNHLAGFIQPMRYWWELTLPRWYINSPPVLSTAWIVNRSEFIRIGGFKAVKRSILPERSFAMRFNLGDKYAFIGASDLIDVQTVKPIEDQRQTAIRVRYPQIHRRPELVLLLSITEIITFVLPYVFLIYGLLLVNWLTIIIASLAIITNTITHVLITIISNPSNVPLALLNFPIIVATELVLGIESMLRYEFMQVNWKDRNICLPVMHVVPKLPDL